MRPIKVVAIIENNSISLRIDKQDRKLRNLVPGEYKLLFSTGFSHILSGMSPAFLWPQIYIRGRSWGRDYEDLIIFYNVSSLYYKSQFRDIIASFILMNSHAMYPAFCCGVTRGPDLRWEQLCDR